MTRWLSKGVAERIVPGACVLLARFSLTGVGIGKKERKKGCLLVYAVSQSLRRRLGLGLLMSGACEMASDGSSSRVRSGNAGLCLIRR